MNKPVSREEFEIADIDSALAAEAPEKSPRRHRKMLFIGFALLLLKVGTGWVGYQWLAGDGRIETDNAYVGADTASITPLVGGQVAAVLASDAQSVNAGQPLVLLDQSDA